jgi:hypothetical protein
MPDHDGRRWLRRPAEARVAKPAGTARTTPLSSRID